MYLTIDVGGTKTLVAVFDNGAITEHVKFPTPPTYEEFITELAATITGLSQKDFQACGLALPGKIDRVNGVGISFGNLSWENVTAGPDVEKIVHCPVVVENDANLAALSEALLVADKYHRALYLTISTGIGSGFVVDGTLEPNMLDEEAGHMLLEYKGEMHSWESFASGKAIVAKYGMKASEIEDPETWQAISKDIARGLLNVIVIMQPDVIILGGGVGAHFKKYEKFLVAELKKYETPMLPVPPIIEAQRPEEAVIYGCYELARKTYGPGTH